MFGGGGGGGGGAEYNGACFCRQQLEGLDT